MNFKEACHRLWCRANNDMLTHRFNSSYESPYDSLSLWYPASLDVDLTVTLERSADNKIELSYGYENSTYHTAIIFTDQRSIVPNSCEDCGMCHEPGGICRVPLTVIVCTPEELVDKVEAQISKILEMEEDESEHLRLGAIWAILENVVREAKGRHIFSQCNLRLEGKNHLRLELGSKEDGVLIDAFGDEYGWRFDSHKIRNGEREKFETHRFLDQTPLANGLFSCDCCSGRPGRANFAYANSMVDELIDTIQFYEGI